MGPIVFLLLLISGILILKLNRINALSVLIICGTLIPMNDRIVIGGFDFFSIRILITFFIIRFLIKKSEFNFKYNFLDGLFFSFLFFDFTLYIIRYNFYFGAIANRLGFLFSNLFLYLIFRISIKDIGDFKQIFKIVSVVCILISIAMFTERILGKPIFTILGGFPFLVYRDGHVRARGPFAHSSNAGIFAATSLPFILYLFFHTKKKKYLLGILSILLIVYTSNSSTPVIAFLFSMVAISLWFIKDKIKVFKTVVLVILIALDIKMHFQVWDLIAIAGNIIGGGGEYRSALIEKAFDHFSEWWLLGTSYTVNWTHSAVSETSADLANQFILYGVEGGFISMLLFIIFVIFLFKTNSFFSDNEKNGYDQFLFWTMGASLTAHIASFFCTSYFDQVSIYWYLLVSMIVFMRNEYNKIKNTTLQNQSI